VDRRAVFGLLVAACASRVLAQDRAPVRVIGYLLEGEGYPRRTSVRLGELGYVEGRNMRFEIRRVPEGAREGEYERAASELVRSGAEVLVAYGVASLTALHHATSKIPIVSAGVSNPVGVGLARSLGKPGMNVTGLSNGLEEAAVLQIGTLRVLRPRLKRVWFVAAGADSEVAPEHASAAAAVGVTTDAVSVKAVEDIDRLFAGMRDPDTEAAWISDLPRIGEERIAASAIRHRVATHGKHAGAVRKGLLMSYWLDNSDDNLRLATVIDKILRGGNPADIPFQVPDKTVFALNRATAAAIGATVTEDLLLRATEVIG
jgi:putative ABC transport system substrate-binding protein